MLTSDTKWHWYSIFSEHIFFLVSCWKSLNQFLLVSISFSLIRLVALKFADWLQLLICCCYYRKRKRTEHNNNNKKNRTEKNWSSPWTLKRHRWKVSTEGAVSVKFLIVFLDSEVCFSQNCGFGDPLEASTAPLFKEAISVVLVCH